MEPRLDITAGGMNIARARKGQGIYFDHSDHLGSPVAQTYKSNGGVATRTRYTPFGLAMDDPNLLKDQAGFTGHIKDSATGLNYMQARYYDPVIGRFLSVDPVTFLDTGNPGYFNRYSYTMNDPVNMVDPDGEKTIWGWAVARVNGGLKKQAVLKSKEHAIRAARKGQDIQSANGRSAARSVAKATSDGRRIEREDAAGHLLRDGSGVRGAPHFHNGKGGHIFWEKFVPAVIATLTVIEQLDPFYAGSLDGGVPPNEASNSIDQQWNELQQSRSESNKPTNPDEVGVNLSSDLRSSSMKEALKFPTCYATRIGDGGC